LVRSAVKNKWVEDNWKKFEKHWCKVTEYKTSASC